jgi:hypothetical protein
MFIFSLISLYGHSKSKAFVSQDTHDQAGIAYNGGLLPLLKLLDSKNGSLQHNAAFALYGVADNEVIHDYSNQNGAKFLKPECLVFFAEKGMYSCSHVPYQFHVSFLF